MKHERISIKWKIFCYLLLFTGILLIVLWLIQICYLDTFYKHIKNREAEELTNEMIRILQSDEAEKEEQIDALTARYNMAVLVAEQNGNILYSAEYIPNSRLDTMPVKLVQDCYKQAVENGGSIRMEFDGEKRKPQHFEQPSVPDGFLQNHGQERIESLITVNLVPIDGKEVLLFVNAQLTPVDATVNTLRAELIWITLIMILLSLGIALLISRQVSKSLIKMNETAKQMAKGDFSVRFEAKDYKEAAELSDTLNCTAAELNRNESLRRELIANVSHDLRTPLTMIIAYAEVMRDLPGENTPENVQVVIDEASRLTNLVNDMLDISKLQSGVMTKNAAIYNLTESIEAVLERYRKLREQDGYIIEFDYDEKVFVNADEYKIFQVIYNLINNAVNYTGMNKKVRVSQKIIGKRVRIEVADSGAGIAEKDLPYVWDRYYKVDKTHKRSVMGTGLGLSIVKNILELHEASYGVQSIEHTGSVFWFELEIQQ